MEKQVYLETMDSVEQSVTFQKSREREMIDRFLLLIIHTKQNLLIQLFYKCNCAWFLKDNSYATLRYGLYGLHHKNPTEYVCWKGTMSLFIKKYSSEAEKQASLTLQMDC